MRLRALVVGSAVLAAALGAGNQAPRPPVTSGVLLGVGTGGEYRTLWITVADGRSTIVASGNGLLVPRRTGFWWVGVKPPGRDWFDTFVWAAPAGKTLTIREGEFEYAEDLRRWGGVNDPTIAFVGPDHVTIDQTFEAHGPSIAYNQLLNVFALDALEHPTVTDVEFSGLDIDGVLGPGSRRALELAGKAAARAETEMADTFDPDWVDYSDAYWGIVRRPGGWSVVGRAGHSSGVARGYYIDYDVPVAVPASVAGAPAPDGPTWDLALEEVPDATDLLTAPTGDIVLVVTPRRLWVLPYDGHRLGPALGVVSLSQPMSVVMEQWATGVWVDRWTSQVVPLLRQGIPEVEDSRSPANDGPR